MTKALRIPDEPRFVRAFALAVDPGDTLTLLMEIGALGRPDFGIVRRTREALIPAYDRASDLKDWELTHTIGVLREALAQPDSAAYLAYHARSNHQTGDSAPNCAEALAVIGCAADSLTSHRRPWEVEPNALSLPEWRERLWKLFFASPGNALPRPSESPPERAAPCPCSDGKGPGPPAYEYTG
jgi:hypothetical protein